MIDEGFNVLVKLCELGCVLHVLEVLDLLVRDRVGADGDIAAAWRISWRRAMLSFVAEGPTYDTGSCEVPSGCWQVAWPPKPIVAIIIHVRDCTDYCPAERNRANRTTANTPIFSSQKPCKFCTNLAR